jgi:hypothetical protein
LPMSAAFSFGFIVFCRTFEMKYAQDRALGTGSHLDAQTSLSLDILRLSREESGAEGIQ